MKHGEQTTAKNVDHGNASYQRRDLIEKMHECFLLEPKLPDSMVTVKIFFTI